VASIATLALWAIPLPASPYTRSAAAIALRTFAHWERPMAALRPGVPSTDSLIATYRRLTRAPVPNARSAYFGRARGANVIVFLFETLPWACYAMPNAAAYFPAFHALGQRAFVGTAHYSTYAYSARAYESIFSSWYPSNGTRELFDQRVPDHEPLMAPGMVRTLRDDGYATAMFDAEIWEPLIPTDAQRFEVLGFERRVVSGRIITPKQAGADRNLNWVDAKHRRDAAELASLEREIVNARQAGHPFLFAFNPQQTHGRWPGVTETSTLAETCAAGLPLFRVVDDMLGELTRFLRDQGLLEQTILVVMGDHGLRFAHEYPAIPRGMLDDLSYHVPFLIAAPGVLTQTVEIPWMTSHIDVAPSVLDLLGVENGRALELGSPIWDPRLADRMTFFLGKDFLGADGYRDGDRIMMRKYLFGGVATAPWTGRIAFAPQALVTTPAALADTVARTLDELTAVQRALALFMRPGQFALVRGAPYGAGQRDSSGVMVRSEPD
jgi:hypothetical protein